jgi:acyl-CoA thioesterase
VTSNRAFWAPEAISQADGRYRLPASDAACVGAAGRFAPLGGVTAGAAIDAMEQATGKSVIWATCQFANPAPTETDFDIDVDIVGGGKRTPQARATLRSGNLPCVIAMGALGEVATQEGQSFDMMPAVSPPLDTAIFEDQPGSASGGLLNQFERRLAHRDETTGRQAMWFRSVNPHPVRSGLLAIIADFLAGAYSQTRTGISLELTLQMVARPQTNWILAVSAIAHIGEKTFHGATKLFAESGQLMATSSVTGLTPHK